MLAQRQLALYMLTRQRLIGIILSGQLAGQRLKILDVLRRPPVGQRAGLVIFRTLIVEMMAQFMTNDRADRSEEHTSELQSLMRISYAVFCLKKKKSNKKLTNEYPE